MTDRGVENVAQTFQGKTVRGDVWRVDQVYTKIILNFYQKKLKFTPILRRNSGAFQGKKNFSNLHKYERTEAFY